MLFRGRSKTKICITRVGSKNLAIGSRYHHLSSCFSSLICLHVLSRFTLLFSGLFHIVCFSSSKTMPLAKETISTHVKIQATVPRASISKRTQKEPAMVEVVVWKHLQNQATIQRHNLNKTLF